MGENLTVLTTEIIMNCDFNNDSLCWQYCIDNSTFIVGNTTCVNITDLYPGYAGDFVRDLSRLSNEEKLEGYCGCVHEALSLNCTAVQNLSSLATGTDECLEYCTPTEMR